MQSRRVQQESCKKCVRARIQCVRDFFKVSQAAAAAASSANDMRHHLGQHNGGGGTGISGHHTNQQLSQQDTLSPDLGEYIVLLERVSCEL